MILMKLRKKRWKSILKKEKEIGGRLLKKKKPVEKKKKQEQNKETEKELWNKLGDWTKSLNKLKNIRKDVKRSQKQIKCK